MVLPLVFAGVAAVGTGLNYLQGRENAKAQREFQRRRQEAITKAAIASMLEAGVSTRVRTFQERARTTANIRDFVEEATRERGVVQVSAGARGVSGRSVENQVNEVYAQENRTVNRFKLNDQFQESAAEFRLRNLAITTQGRIAAGEPPPVFEPNPWTTGFNIVSSGFQGYSLGLDIANNIG